MASGDKDVPGSWLQATHNHAYISHLTMDPKFLGHPMCAELEIDPSQVGVEFTGNQSTLPEWG